MLEGATMSLSEKSSERKFPLQFTAPSENVLLVVIAVCFLILHILAGAILISVHRSDALTSPEPAGLLSGD
jgi:hypothetical protein